MHNDYDGGEERRRFQAKYAFDEVERAFAWLLLVAVLSYGGVVIAAMIMGRL